MLEWREGHSPSREEGSFLSLDEGHTWSVLPRSRSTFDAKQNGTPTLGQSPGVRKKARLDLSPASGASFFAHRIFRESWGSPGLSYLRLPILPLLLVEDPVAHATHRSSCIRPHRDRAIRGCLDGSEMVPLNCSDVFSTSIRPRYKERMRITL